MLWERDILPLIPLDPRQLHGLCLQHHLVRRNLAHNVLVAVEDVDQGS